MNNLLLLIATIISSIGAAALILALGKIIIIALPEILMRTVRSNGASSVPVWQRPTGQIKAGSCPYCQSGE